MAGAIGELFEVVEVLCVVVPVSGEDGVLVVEVGVRLSTLLLGEGTTGAGAGAGVGLDTGAGAGEAVATGVDAGACVGMLAGGAALAVFLAAS